jgi:hypothetical protein
MRRVACLCVALLAVPGAGYLVASSSLQPQCRRHTLHVARTAAPLAVAQPFAEDDLQQELATVSAKFLKYDAQATAAKVRIDSLKVSAREQQAQLKKCMETLGRMSQTCNQLAGELRDVRQSEAEQRRAFESERRDLHAQIASQEARMRAANAATAQQRQAYETERQELLAKLAAHDERAAVTEAERADVAKARLEAAEARDETAALERQWQLHQLMCFRLAEMREEELLARAADAAEAAKRAEAEAAVLRAKLGASDAAAELSASDLRAKLQAAEAVAQLASTQLEEHKRKAEVEIAENLECVRSVAAAASPLAKPWHQGGQPLFFRDDEKDAVARHERRLARRRAISSGANVASPTAPFIGGLPSSSAGPGFSRMAPQPSAALLPAHAAPVAAQSESFAGQGLTAAPISSPAPSTPSTSLETAPPASTPHNTVAEAGARVKAAEAALARAQEAAERVAAERVAAERVAAERVAAERVAAEKMAAHKVESGLAPAPPIHAPVPIAEPVESVPSGTSGAAGLAAHVMIERVKKELNLEGCMQDVTTSACNMLGLDQRGGVIVQLRAVYQALFEGM